MGMPKHQYGIEVCAGTFAVVISSLLEQRPVVFADLRQRPA
jgi:hypothetical protein